MCECFCVCKRVQVCVWEGQSGLFHESERSLLRCGMLGQQWEQQTGDPRPLSCCCRKEDTVQPPLYHGTNARSLFFLFFWKFWPTEIIFVFNSSSFVLQVLTWHVGHDMCVIRTHRTGGVIHLQPVLVDAIHGIFLKGNICVCHLCCWAFHYSFSCMSTIQAHCLSTTTSLKQNKSLIFRINYGHGYFCSKLTKVFCIPSEVDDLVTNTAHFWLAEG